jgi:ferredoxin/phthalate 3,4-dioxygenase ferredoxin subunit
MEITVDSDKCCGYGDCVLAAPDVYELGDDGVARVLPGADLSAPEVWEGADACPVAAIELGT